MSEGIPSQKSVWEPQIRVTDHFITWPLPALWSLLSTPVSIKSLFLYLPTPSYPAPLGCRALGLDLPALDFQRQRDQFLPSYREARIYCGLHNGTTWDWVDFYPYMTPDVSVVNTFYNIRNMFPLRLAIYKFNFEH